MSENSSAGFSIDPDAVRTIAGNLGGILMQAITVSRDLERLVVAPTVYSQIGSAVASGSAALQDGQVSAMGAMMRVLSHISSEIGQVAASTKTMDADIATGLDGLPDSGASGLGSSGSGSSGSGLSLWGSAAASLLARTAMGSGGHPATGGSVENVLGYLGRTGMGQLAEHPVAHGQFQTPTALADWLDADPDNQTQLGLIGVYAGDTGTLADVPGGLHPGDVVYVDRWQLAGSDLTPSSLASLGVVGSDGRLYNHGAISTAGWSGVTDLRVYRPIGAS